MGRLLPSYDPISSRSQTANSGTLHLISPKATPPTPPSHSEPTPTTPISCVLQLEPSLQTLIFFQTDPCGLQLFHLLSHTEGRGGATLLVDGFYVASLLKELHPEAYALLSSVPVPAHAAGEPSALYQPSPASGYPTLGHDRLTGELTQVRWNNDDRSVMNHLEPAVVEKW